MDINGKSAAVQATMGLLKLAKQIADSVVGEADQETVRAVFDRLCMENDMRPEPDPTGTVAVTHH